jgi:hypothetical protein
MIWERGRSPPREPLDEAPDLSSDTQLTRPKGRTKDDAEGAGAGRPLLGDEENTKAPLHY